MIFDSACSLTCEFTAFTTSLIQQASYPTRKRIAVPIANYIPGEAKGFGLLSNKTSGGRKSRFKSCLANRSHRFCCVVGVAPIRIGKTGYGLVEDIFQQAFASANFFTLSVQR